MEPDSMKCELCNVNILAKCYDIHKRACQKKLQKTNTKVSRIPILEDLIPCSECGEMVPFSLYAIHEQECVGRQMTKCLRCRLLYPTFLIEQHLSVCNTYVEEPIMPEVKVGNKNEFLEEEYDEQFQAVSSQEEHDEQMNDMIMELAKNVPKEDEPLTLQQVNKIPQTTSSKLQECSICYMKVFPKTMILKLPCPHRFHHKCISAWLQKNPQCPMCRKHALSGK